MGGGHGIYKYLSFSLFLSSAGIFHFTLSHNCAGRYPQTWATTDRCLSPWPEGLSCRSGPGTAAIAGCTYFNYFACCVLACRVDRMKSGFIVFIPPACLFPWIVELLPLNLLLALYFMLHPGFLCFPSFFMVCVFFEFYYCCCWIFLLPFNWFRR